jgi:hypothetical protein
MVELCKQVRESEKGCKRNSAAAYEMADLVAIAATQRYRTRDRVDCSDVNK